MTNSPSTKPLAVFGICGEKFNGKDTVGLLIAEKYNSAFCVNNLAMLHTLYSLITMMMI
jgi:hypothetical protein